MFKALIWFLFFYLVYRLIRNIFAPVRTTHQPTGSPYNSTRKAGETEITNVPEEYKSRKKNDKEGEYIDYKDV
jgi:hypothetical protein